MLTPANSGATPSRGAPPVPLVDRRITRLVPFALIAESAQVKTPASQPASISPANRGPRRLNHSDAPAEPAPQADPSISALVAGALAWWAEAGVDCAYLDTPQSWTIAEEQAHPAAGDAPAAAPQPAPPPAAAPIVIQKIAKSIGGPRESWPTTLPAFQAWWLTEPALDPTASDQTPPPLRIPPRGPASPPLMILVAEPEAGDTDQLLSGPQGKLLAAILPQLGLAEAEVYIASVLPRPLPLADWAELSAQGWGDILAHHIALVAPARVIAFGSSVLSLLGHDPAQNTAFFSPLNHGDWRVPLLGARELAMLLERPAAKAAFWQSWLGFPGSGLAPISAGRSGSETQRPHV